jgi:hypothetical protein
LDLARIIAELKNEQDRIERAINALLEGTGLVGRTGQSAPKAVAAKRRGGITPAGRRRIAAAMRARWAERKAKSAPTSHQRKAVAKTTVPKRRAGGLTAAGRKRLSEMMKRRWAERRKKANGFPIRANGFPIAGRRKKKNGIPIHGV